LHGRELVPSPDELGGLYLVVHVVNGYGYNFFSTTGSQEIGQEECL